MKQAMILAAGLGTRLKPMTDTMPKALVPVAGQPLLYHIVTKLKTAGFERIVVNIHHFGQQIIDYLAANQNFGLDIRISDERQQLLDTGGGLKHAVPLFEADSPFLIHNVDIFSNADLSALYDEALQRNTDALLLICRRKTSRNLLFDEEMRLRGWTNDDKGIVKIAGEASSLSSLPSPLTSLGKYAFTGIHVFHPRLAEQMMAMPEKFGVFDFYMKYCVPCSIVGRLQADLRMLDVGKLDTLELAEQFLLTK